jgi:hypothetical protein
VGRSSAAGSPVLAGGWQGAVTGVSQRAGRPGVEGASGQEAQAQPGTQVRCCALVAAARQGGGPGRRGGLRRAARHWRRQVAAQQPAAHLPLPRLRMWRHLRLPAGQRTCCTLSAWTPAPFLSALPPSLPPALPPSSPPSLAPLSSSILLCSLSLQWYQRPVCSSRLQLLWWMAADCRRDGRERAGMQGWGGGGRAESQ